MTHTVISVRTHERTEFVDITGKVTSAVSSSGVTRGICSVFVPHTTAGVTINEAADPDVVKDILEKLNRVIPFQNGYAHREGNSAAHIKTTLTGSSVTIPIVNGSLQLGTWQGIYFCEFDGPRSRTASITLIGGT